MVRTAVYHVYLRCKTGCPESPSLDCFDSTTRSARWNFRTRFFRPTTALASLSEANKALLVNDPSGDTGVLQPGRVGVAEVVGAVQADRLQQGMLGGCSEHPSVGLGVDGCGAGRGELGQGAVDGGHRGGAALSRRFAPVGLLEPMLASAGLAWLPP
jgi:hypothetical protein